MKFGFDGFVKVDDYPSELPLPNGYSSTYIENNISKLSYDSLSHFNVYRFLFKKEMDYKEWGFGYDTVENLIQNNEVFVYPILIRDKEDFAGLIDNGRILINDMVVNAVKNGKAKIVLSYLFEGDFYSEEDFSFVNRFVKKYNFIKQDVLLLTNNLRIRELPYDADFSIATYNYFLSNPWFINEDLLDKENDIQLKNDLDRKLQYVKSFTKIKAFLCLNRRPRPHRIVLFTEISKNPKLLDNTMLSLGNKELDINTGNNKTSWMSAYNRLITNDFKYNKMSGMEFLRDYDNSNTKFIDANPTFNLAFNINETIQLNTFVNVITETLYENETIFLSEKIWKPIFSCQPFIVLGNPHTLRELKNLGFKTFSDFWDESYDQEENFEKRVEKILDVLNELNTKTQNELLHITREMSDILAHNYTNFLVKSREEIFTLKRILNEQFS
jgi:hypothetical protein